MTHLKIDVLNCFLCQSVASHSRVSLFSFHHISLCQVTFFNSSMVTSAVPSGDSVDVAGSPSPAVVHPDGMLLFAADGNAVNVKQLQIRGKMSAASSYGKAQEARQSLELTDEEIGMREAIRTIWKGILLKDVDDETDFFASGSFAHP